MKTIARLFIILQLFLLLPSIIFIAMNFFEGQDTLQKSFIYTEVNHFIRAYKKDTTVELPKSYTTFSFIGLDDMPAKFRDLVSTLSPGLHELKIPDTIDPKGEKEFRVLIEKISSQSPLFYFFSIIDDAEGEVTLIKQLIFPLTTYVIVTALFSLFIARYIAKNIAQPISNISNTVNFINEENPLSDLSHINRNDEIGELAKNIESKNKRIAEFITREKNTIRNISHELKTPITVLKSTLSIVKQQKKQHENYLLNTDLYNKLERATDDLKNMVEAFLWLGQEKKATEVTTDYASCIEKSIINFEHLLAQKKIVVKTNIEYGTKIYCPNTIFYILVGNLIRNAFLFTDNGEINIQLKNDSFSISDTGPGLDESIAHIAKKPGVKADNSSGFGIGLHIVERICNHMEWLFTIKTNESQNGTIAIINFSNTIR